MSCEIKIEDISILDIIEKSDLTLESKEKLKKASIILFPASFPNSYNRGNFPSETPDLLKYIRTTDPEISIALFENLGDEKTQGLHAADIILPPLYYAAQTVSIQIILAILSSYLYDKLKGNLDREKQRIKTEIFYNESENGKVKHIKYEGPLSGLKDVEKLANSNQKVE